MNVSVHYFLIMVINIITTFTSFKHAFQRKPQQVLAHRKIMFPAAWPILAFIFQNRFITRQEFEIHGVENRDGTVISLESLVEVFAIDLSDFSLL